MAREPAGKPANRQSARPRWCGREHSGSAAVAGESGLAVEKIDGRSGSGRTTDSLCAQVKLENTSSGPGRPTSVARTFLSTDRTAFPDHPPDPGVHRLYRKPLHSKPSSSRL